MRRATFTALLGDGAVAMIALITIVILYRRSTSLDADAQAAYSAVIAHLREHDSLVDQDVLRLRQGYLNHYDALETEVNLIAADVAQLVLIPAFCDAAARTAMQHETTACTALLADKRDAIEDFKSYRAVLVNSLRYLPLEVADIAAHAATPEDRAVAQHLDRALRELLLYNLDGDPAQAEACRISLAALGDVKAAVAGGRGNVSLAVEHARRVLDTRPLVDAATARILDNRDNALLDRLETAFAAGNRRVVRTGEIHRALLVAVCALLAAGIMVFLQRLRAALTEVGAAKAHLEQRVSARTTELAGANAALATGIAERQAAIDELTAAQARIAQALAGERASEVERRLVEAQFERFFALFPDLMCTSRVDGRLLRVNAAWSDLLGWSAAELLARPFIEFVHPDDAARTREEFAKLAAGAASVEFEDRWCRRDGGWLALGWKAATLPGEGLVLAVGRDISATRAHERALTDAKEAAESATHAKAQFLATMSHEIRTPMNGVIGMTQVLLTTALGAEQRAMMETIHRSGRALLDILNDILDYSKITEGAIDIRNAAFAPRHLVEDVVATLRPQAAAKGLALDVQIAADVPVRLVGDVGRLRQILCNLLGNALKFTHQGGAIVSLAALDATATGDRRYRFSIVDTGIGISAQDRHKLFQDFSQIDATNTRRYGGTGLGLAICKRLVAMMGGTIAVEGDEGRGSTFSFTVPMATAAAAPAEDSVAILPPQRPLRILVVEDNRTNQMVLKAMLAPHGHTCQFASDGRAGVEGFAAAPWDIVLMDVQMPVMDGLAATRRIRQIEQEEARQAVPIIALTAGVMDDERQACTQAGMVDLVPKPIIAEQLLATIARWSAVAG